MVMFLPLVERYLLQGLIDPEQMVLYLFNLDFFSKVSGVMLLTLKVVVFPKIILLPESRKIEVFKKHLKLCVFFAIGLILISPLLTYFFHNVILKPLGHSDLFDKYVSIVMIVYTLTLSINYMILIGLVIINKNKYLIITTTLTLVLHIVGIYMLSPKYGALGASLSLLLSSLVSIIVLFLITYKGIDDFQKNNHKIYKT
jgi:O-antigen/teichoic acid export membrane protein